MQRHFAPNRLWLVGWIVVFTLALAACAPFTPTPAPPSTSTAGGTSVTTPGATATGALPAPGATPAASAARFAGTVKHAGRPAPDARVELRALGWTTSKTPPIATVQADSQGNFSMTDAPTGDFSVVGYFADGEMDAGGWPPISIAAGQQVTGFVVPLERKLILLAPIAASIVSNTVTLSWHPAAGAQTYRVWVLDAGTTEMKLDATTRETTLAAPADLPPGEYQWVVNGLDAEGQIVATGQETFMFRAGSGETPGATNTPGPTGEARGDMPRLPDDERAFAAVRAVLAARLGVDELAIQRIEVTPRQWKDACLGVPGGMCAQVITPGWIVIAETGGRSYEAHTDQEGRQVRFVGLR